jgi:hypothetical protein
VVAADDTSVVSSNPNSCHCIKPISLPKEKKDNDKKTFCSIFSVVLSLEFSNNEWNNRSTRPLLILLGQIHHHQHRHISPESKSMAQSLRHQGYSEHQETRNQANRLT